MPDVNDDMDELFKRAAEHYPLNTDSSDWNEVSKTLTSLNMNIPADNVNKKNKSRRLLWLLLLLPLMIAIYKYYAFKQVHQITHDEKLSHKRPAKNFKLSLPAQNNVNEKNLAGKSPGGILSNKIVALASKHITHTGRLQKPGPFITAGNSNQNLVPENNPNTARENDTIKTPENDGNIRAAEKDRLNTGNTSAGDINAITSTIEDKPGKDVKISVPPVQNDLHKTVSDTSNLANHKNHVSHKSRKPHLYVGIMGGADISSVKLQKVIKTGFTAGILAGYRLGKRWSLEGGLYLDKKYYYTEGKYFSTNKIPIPASIKIEDAFGNCRMLELPLNIKYDFTIKQKTSWFILAGISSYLMKKEDYGYTLTTYGQMPWVHEYSYTNSSKNWASILNLSAGYSRNIGRTGVLRIEPYIKIPLKGVGIGSLPITSSGVYLGFTKNLF